MEEKINEILEEMIDKMGQGGMDVSYSGHNYESAKLKAVEQIKDLITKNV